MKLEECKFLCRKARENEFDYLQKDRRIEIAEGRYTFRNCNKPAYLECTPETKYFQFLYIILIYSVKNREDLEDIEEIADLLPTVKQERLFEKLGKEGFQYNTKELFEPITRAVTDSNQKLLEGTKSARKAIEALDESNVHVTTLEARRKDGLIH